MTKKDYDKAAKIAQRAVKQSRVVGKDEDGQDIVDMTEARAIINAFVDLFMDGNPKFDVVRFKDACNPNPYYTSLRFASSGRNKRLGL